MPAQRYPDTGMEQGLCWWAVYTRHQHEKMVARVLTVNGIEVFLPLYESMRRWKDRNKMLMLPLFPGYLSVRGGQNRRLTVVSTPGVHLLLSNRQQVAKIQEAEIQAIRKTVEGVLPVEPHPFIECGERVRVKRRPLQGVEGLLVRRKNQYRLVLSVAMLAQSVGVEIDSSDVEPVTEQSLTAGFQVGRPLTVCWATMN